MAAAAPSIDLTEAFKPKSDKSTSAERIKKTHTNELVFALCGPIGSPIHAVATSISTISKDFGYISDIVRLSDYIESYGAKHFPNLVTSPSGSTGFKRIRNLIECGNKLREVYGLGILAELGISEICKKRLADKKAIGAPHFPPTRRCYIFDSIKNQAELDILRLVYGELLFCIGITAPLISRTSQLTQMGLNSREINILIDQDSGEELENGQTVRDTFPQADYFIMANPNDGDLGSEIDSHVRRILSLITKSEILTPTTAETAMYAAASAATNSACLSRQVGAAITDISGKIIGTGWNDVPRYEGGVYTQTDANLKSDKRCYSDGECRNDIRKSAIIEETLNGLIGSGLLDQAKRKEGEAVIKRSRVRHLIEFSRAVHAEMLAIINSAQSTGPQMKGGIIYCTTYPCHSCARHIIAAGLVEIVYIEPYRKSLAIELHGDALTETGESNKVLLTQYAGVAPRRYLSLFQAESDSRKKNGKKFSPDAATASIVSRVSLEPIPVLEALVLDQIVKIGLIEKEEVDRADEQRSA